MSIQKLDKLIGRLKEVSAFLIEEGDAVILRTRKVLIDENKRRLREEGKDTLGMPLEYQKTRIGQTGRYGWYSKGYESTKRGNVLYVDLYNTGEFHRSIGLLQFNPGNWRFVSEDEKIKYLEANYGENILGVDEEFLDYYSENIMKYQLQQKLDNFLSV